MPSGNWRKRADSMMAGFWTSVRVVWNQVVTVGTSIKRVGSPILRNWQALVQTTAIAVTAVFTGLLYKVTDSYTEFTRRIFESQHEKYVYDVVGERAFEVAISPSSPLREFDEPQLWLRVKNLTALEFKRPYIRIYAEIYDVRKKITTKTLVFAPFVGEVLIPEGTLVIEDKQNDIAFNLRESGFVDNTGVLKPQFELNRFVAQVEALSPGGVLWQLKEEK